MNVTRTGYARILGPVGCALAAQRGDEPSRGERATYKHGNRGALLIQRFDPLAEVDFAA